MSVPTFAIALCTTIVLGGCLAETDTETEIEVSTFEECEAADYTISESQPRTCTTPSGDVYVESQRSEGGNVLFGISAEVRIPVILLPSAYYRLVSTDDTVF